MVLEIVELEISPPHSCPDVVKLSVTDHYEK
jgi:hypothetical protein